MGNAGLRLREMALPRKRRGGVAPRRFEIRGFCRFPLPCFATGFHTDHFKIATAAGRPRNDTKMVGFAIKPTIFISEMFKIRLAGAPCFAKGCHTLGFKIATAALRPRNDTKMVGFLRKTYHFSACQRTPAFARRKQGFFDRLARPLAALRFLY